MSFLTSYLTQTITVWRRTGLNGYGEQTFAAPTQIKARWEQRGEQIRNSAGIDIMSHARIFLGEDVAMGDYVFLGTSATADPRDVAGAEEVIEFRKIPSLEGDLYERKAYT